MGTTVLDAAGYAHLLIHKQFIRSRFIGPCKSWTDARFGITQFVTPNTHVFKHPGV